MKSDQQNDFMEMVWEYYSQHKRDFLWRESLLPYHVLVSEIMLQQTQVKRIETKFPEFIEIFPSFESLASAPFEKVLSVWQGLGYNRRALYLHKIAKLVVEAYGGELPSDIGTLESFPGIGPNTARSIVTFAWNTPTVFIETNIRTVFIHEFFKENLGSGKKVSDEKILELVAKTLDHKNPREWYYALMDYGTHLKATHGNANRRSSGYRKQSTFKGSNRQIRASILRAITNGHTNLGEIFSYVKDDIATDHPDLPEESVSKNIATLCSEGFLKMATNRKITCI